MSSSLILVGAGLALLYFGAEGLVRGSAALALRLGVAPLIIGLTIVAAGTSAPELVVSLGASLSGSGDIALGNVVGSNICNVALILGLSALIRALRVDVQLLRLDVPCMIASSLLLVLFLLDSRLTRLEGGALLTGIIAYTAFNIRQARRERADVQATFADALPRPDHPAWRDVLFIAGGLGLLVWGGGLLVTGASAIAERLGLSEAFIGLTIVAVGTSLPELATSVVAAFKGEGDLAIGNVVGSNVFNILGILGLSALAHPLQRQGVDGFDLGVMTALALLLMPLMRTGFRLTRAEGALLLVLYGSYVYVLMP